MSMAEYDYDAYFPECAEEYYEQYDFEPRYLSDSTVWRDYSGKVLRISEMETSHLINCIRFLKRDIRSVYNVSFRKKLINMEAELKRRMDLSQNDDEDLVIIETSYE